MGWMSVTLAITLMAMTCAAQDDGAAIISIAPAIIEITPPNTYIRTEMDVLEVCYTINQDIADTINKITLVIRRIEDGHHIESFYFEHVDDNPINQDCKYFEGEIPETFTGEVIFSLLGQTDHIAVTHAEAGFTFPDSSDASKVSSSLSVGEKTSLRFTFTEAFSVDWNLCGDTAFLVLKCDSTGLICYAINVGEVAECSLCLKATDSSNAIFKAFPIEVTDVEDTFPVGDPSEVLLTYTVENVNQHKNALQITPKTTVGNLEFVSYNNDGVYPVCTGGESTDCDLDSYTRGNTDMNILLVDVGALKSSVITFTDYNIEGEPLGNNVIEVYWAKDSATSEATYQYFDANIATKDAPDDTVQTVLADCHRDDPVPPTYCYAYFFSLTKATEYLVTVAPNTNDDETWDPLMTNKIQIEGITTGNESPGNKANSISEITLLQDPGHTDGVLQVCFKAHGNDNYTRYEAILIDANGHWMKIYESKQEKNMMNCFSPVNVLKTSLNVTNANKLTVVIVERELGGNRVFASGTVDLDMTALRAIKPEVDNGNNGSTSTLAIVGAAIAGIACLMALVAVAVMFVMKSNRDNDGLENQLHRYNIEDSSIIHGLDNPIPTM